jgi:transglutaminase-like putative cysteine protease
MEKYLRATEIMDWQHPAVFAQAKTLAANRATTFDIVRACFTWVRDSISHTHDAGLETVTCKASAVLQTGTGLCYAKSHLLAALLRANGIPTGLCYQRLSYDEDRSRFSLHGLNAVYLADIGWYRIDARGNKPGVDAQFTPPIEQLAFQITYAGERDIPSILSDPLPEVVRH